MGQQRKEPEMELSDTGHLGKKCNRNQGKEGFKERVVNSTSFLKAEVE